MRGKGGLGLAGMEERVRLLGGTFSIDAGLGRGARIDVHLPVPATTFTSG